MNTHEEQTRVMRALDRMLHCKHRRLLEWVVAPALLVGGLAYLSWRYPIVSAVVSVAVVIAAADFRFG